MLVGGRDSRKGRNVASIVRRSYHELAPNARDLIQAIYDRLFERAPQVRPLFTSAMPTQYRKFAVTLEACALEEENPEALKGVLAELGRHHERRGVVAEHYPILIDVTLEVFAEHLGPRWTPEHDAAWRAALEEVGRRMLDH